MSWKRSAPPRGAGGWRLRWLIAAALLVALPARAVLSSHTGPPGTVPEIKTVDADNHKIILNRAGKITVVIGTSEDSQDAARRAGRAMYPFQGLPNFQLIVVVDLRDSFAAWVPSIVIDRMRNSLNQEAIELKPYYLKNGNPENPRRFCHVVPDFKGTIVPQLNWSGTPDELHAIVYGADGREIQRWENVDRMDKLQATVHTALVSLDQTNRTRIAAGQKPLGAR